MKLSREAKHCKIAREGYPKNKVCTVVSFGDQESTVRLPDGEVVTLYTAFLYRDLETVRLDHQQKQAIAKTILDNAKTRRESRRKK